MQTFPVVPEIIQMGIPVSDVVFAFNSNWGGNLTCIYRVSLQNSAPDFGGPT